MCVDCDRACCQFREVDLIQLAGASEVITPPHTHTAHTKQCSPRTVAGVVRLFASLARSVLNSLPAQLRSSDVVVLFDAYTKISLGALKESSGFTGSSRMCCVCVELCVFVCLCVQECVCVCEGACLGALKESSGFTGSSRMCCVCRVVCDFVFVCV